LNHTKKRYSQTAKPVELGLILEREDAERFFEYDKDPEV
jgi:hypothetical protein